MKTSEIIDFKDSLIEDSFFSKTPERKLSEARENVETIKVTIFDKWKAKHRMVVELPGENETDESRLKRVWFLE